MKDNINLPVSVLQYPHWRVIFRPAEYNDQLIPSLVGLLLGLNS
jgi:hypothetical protein